MTRLESGALRVRKEWHSLEEVVGAALVRLEAPLGDSPGSPVRFQPISRSSPLDDVLFEQVVWNLVENAHKYSPAELPIELRAVVQGLGFLRFEVADRGPGLPPGDELRMFEKFYRGPDTAGHRGCRARAGDLPGHRRPRTADPHRSQSAGRWRVFTVRLPARWRAARGGA